MSYKWKCLVKEGAIKPMFVQSTSFEVLHHPLKSNTHELLCTNKNVTDLNPLALAFEGADPLFILAQQSEGLKENLVLNSEDVNYLEAWNLKKFTILQKYTTLEKLSIISSFLPGGERMLTKQASSLSEHVKHRLEQLDEFDESSVRKTMGLTQQEYVNKINILNGELTKAWNTEQRVKALKIAIQCSKLLSDTSVMQFYPSKFILITDILDTFGDLVFNRLKNKSFELSKNQRSFDDIDPATVPESAKETCQNWLYKMASIRELLPRLYIEMSLLRCYIFLSKNEFDIAIQRLTRMIRGVGNPLVALYLRCYLCRVAMKVPTKGKDCFYQNLQEFLITYKQIFQPALKQNYASQSLNMDIYLSIHVPAVEWLLFGTVNSGVYNKENLLDELLNKCTEINESELFLWCIVSSFDSHLVARKASCILDMILNTESMIIKHEILVLLGEHLCNMNVYGHSISESLVQTWWKIAMNLSSLGQFFKVLEPWLQYASTHLSIKHINVILRGTIKYIIKSKESIEDYSSNFHSIIKRMLQHVTDVEELFLIDAFMPLLDLLQKSNSRSGLARTVLDIFFIRQCSTIIVDHIVVSNLMRLCCILHDSVTATTVDDEIKIIGDIISKFIQCVSFQDDWEQQLNFYVECRSAFINIDAVLVALVFAVNTLSARMGRDGSASSTKWLQRACVAYCSVTIPSLQCCLIKAQLYLLSGQMALLNNCIGQAEACFKASIGLVPEIPEKLLEDGQMKSTQIRVHALISNFLSTLLVMPDNLEGNCKAYLLNGLIKALQKLSWDKTNSMYYSLLLLILDLLCNMVQENYSYHIDSVLSNDSLYGSEDDFIEAIEKYATQISEELLFTLKELGDTKQYKKQHNLALEFFWRVIRRCDLRNSAMATLAVNLWKLSQKHDLDDRLSRKILMFLEKHRDEIPDIVFGKLNFKEVRKGVEV